MSFGFSAGDFITALEIVATVIDALRDTGKAATQYRGVLKQLHSLQTALVAQAVSQCLGTIADFWKTLQKVSTTFKFTPTKQMIQI
ncbi:hypothetical protein F5882DRAFT_455852 [Hyaloscypha sp. PMI_1271]|nr:hypothetical protein F5882DRAFT_455852 [Hyaloscypha sp. PMI_1271]